MKTPILICLFTLLTACSVFGNPGVEIAPYEIIDQAESENIELRRYERLVLVSAPMTDRSGRRNAFSKLFDYISGDNVAAAEIAMTAPVIMDDRKDSGTKIAMTAPVFMDDEQASKQDGYMSFVLPASYTIETAPVPTHPDVKLSEIKDQYYAVIRFSGFLSQSNITEHRLILEKWIDEKGLKVVGEFKSAGYNPPFTLPFKRRNEVLIPVARLTG